jgi:hypothetical protein
LPVGGADARSVTAEANTATADVDAHQSHVVANHNASLEPAEAYDAAIAETIRVKLYSSIRIFRFPKVAQLLGNCDHRSPNVFQDQSTRVCQPWRNQTPNDDDCHDNKNYYCHGCHVTLFHEFASVNTAATMH